MFGGNSVTSIAASYVVPDFTLPELGGGKRSLAAALKKGPVALAFFKGSCPVCQYTFPFLERIHKAYGQQQGVTLWGISQDDARDTQDFVAEYGTSFPMLLDEEGYPVSNAYGLTNVPTVILVGMDGKAQASEHGFSKATLETVSKQFAASTGKAPAQVFRPDENVPDYKPG